MHSTARPCNHSLEMAYFRRGQYLSGSTQSRWLYNRLSSQNGKEIEEKVAEASLSDVRAQALLMELFFQGTFVWGATNRVGSI